jgi:hypothetical protein
MSMCRFLDTEQGDKGSGPVTEHNINEITQDCRMQPAALCTLRYILICRIVACEGTAQTGDCRGRVPVCCATCYIRINNFTAGKHCCVCSKN